MFIDAPTSASIRFSAMNFLAMREHSAKELQFKLSQRFTDSEMVREAVAQLTKDNLQSDERFAEAFVNMRIRQGKGPVRIALELKEKGIVGELIARFVDAQDSQWFDRAIEQKCKRFGAAPVTNLKEKARQMRFLQYRGFTQSQIEATLK
jgi:regulatory protein